MQATSKRRTQTMSYDYQKMHKEVFTNDGIRTLFNVRAKIKSALQIAGAVMAIKVITGPGDAWIGTACLDYLVELGEIREVEQEDCFLQHRIFVSLS